MNNVEKYDNVFMNVFNVSKEILNDSFTFSNVEEWDSVMHMVLISQLEDTFDIMFDTEDILSFESYENGKKIINKYLDEKDCI